MCILQKWKENCFLSEWKQCIMSAQYVQWGEKSSDGSLLQEIHGNVKINPLSGDYLCIIMSNAALHVMISLVLRLLEAWRRRGSGDRLRNHTGLRNRSVYYFIVLLFSSNFTPRPIVLNCWVSTQCSMGRHLHFTMLVERLLSLLLVQSGQFLLQPDIIVYCLALTINLMRGG